jgi:type 1 fimbriae regulatory protein FimB
VKQNKARSVKSVPNAAPVDAHERTRDYLSEAEFLLLLQGTRDSRYRWRNTAMLLLTFYHGLRVSELCHLKRQGVDITHGCIWIACLKGSLSTEQPLRADELRALKRYLPERGDSQVLWCFLTERGDQFTRFAINYLVGVTGERAGLKGCGSKTVDPSDAASHHLRRDAD